ncbi:MAG: acyl-CoA dehydrogenase [Planctomycetes bacterium]|nr:acyl-CoA dehydrogenase [Planctomycetota bacterium]
MQTWTNLTLSEEQEMIVETARKLADDALAPHAEAADECARFPRDAFEAMGELGFLGLPISEESGGVGMGQLAFCLALEELAKACGATALSLAAHTGRCARLIDFFGSAAQREALVEPLTAGEHIGASSLDPSGVVESDGRLTGRAALVTNAEVASTLVVAATSGETVRVFVVSKDAAGLAVEPPASTLGMRASGWADVVLDNVEAGDSLGDDGAVVVAAGLACARTAVAAIALGLAQGAFERALCYSGERATFGKVLAKHQAVAFKLAECATRIATARQQVYHAARLADAGGDHARDAAIAKVVASECATHCADEAIQIHGGYGYVGEYHVERIYRDAKHTEADAGSNHACREFIGASFLGE